MTKYDKNEFQIFYQWSVLSLQDTFLRYLYSFEHSAKVSDLVLTSMQNTKKNAQLSLLSTLSLPNSYRIRSRGHFIRLGQKEPNSNTWAFYSTLLLIMDAKPALVTLILLVLDVPANRKIPIHRLSIFIPGHEDPMSKSTRWSDEVFSVLYLLPRLRQPSWTIQ